MGYSCTAVFWKNDFGDYYLRAYPFYLTTNEAKQKMAEIYGEEFTECMCDFEITWG